MPNSNKSARLALGVEAIAVSRGKENPAQQAIAAALNLGRNALTEPIVKSLLQQIEIGVPRGVTVAAPDEVDAALKSLKLPLAVKIVSPEILHKSDVGGVRLNLGTADAVRTSIVHMAKAMSARCSVVDGYLLEEMVPAGTEMVIGSVTDPCFGPMIMVGMGGVHIEVLKDVVYRICPITEDEAYAMLNELRCSALLDGVRGGAPLSRPALIDILMKLGGERGFLMQQSQDILELDLNPVIVNSAQAIVADAAVILRGRPAPSRPADADIDVEQSADALEMFRPLFEPQTIAVVGASATAANTANTFIRRLRAFGFGGAIYPIHPTALEVEGLPAYLSLSHTPRPIDYAYVAISGDRVSATISEAHGRVRFAQVIASGFGETESGKALERELLETSRANGCRILGPNSLGSYSPRGRLTFASDPPRDVGGIGVILQSGGLGTDVIKRGQSRGLRFSGLVTLGNSADVKAVDLLEFYLLDPQTKVIALYLEDIKNGRRFFDLLRSSRVRKTGLAHERRSHRSGAGCRGVPYWRACWRRPRLGGIVPADGDGDGFRFGRLRGRFAGPPIPDAAARSPASTDCAFRERRRGKRARHRPIRK